MNFDLLSKFKMLRCAFAFAFNIFNTFLKIFPTRVVSVSVSVCFCICIQSIKYQNVF